MKITILGTGTSQGVPVIGCKCEVCKSTNPKDNRLRTAAMIEVDDKTIIIDAGPDFRQQLLRANVEDVTAILITHEHNDHIIGMDDVRPLNFKHEKSMKIFAEERVQIELKKRFAYVFAENPYPGAPRLTLEEVKENEIIDIEGTKIIPIRVWHGKLPIFGYRFRNFTYLTRPNIFLYYRLLFPNSCVKNFD